VGQVDADFRSFMVGLHGDKALGVEALNDGHDVLLVVYIGPVYFQIVNVIERREQTQKSNDLVGRWVPFLQLLELDI